MGAGKRPEAIQKGERRHKRENAGILSYKGDWEFHQKPSAGGKKEKGRNDQAKLPMELGGGLTSGSRSDREGMNFKNGFMRFRMYQL